MTKEYKKIYTQESHKREWLGSCDPLNFWPLNANSSKMVKAADFKFDDHVCRDRTPEKESLQASSSENRHRGCGSDVLRQTVPSAGGGNRKGTITDGGHWTAVCVGQSATSTFY